MIKASKKDDSARVCYTFDNKPEKISIKERKPEGEVSVKLLNNIKNVDLVVKQDNCFIVDKDARQMYRVFKGELRGVVQLFHKQYFGVVQTPENSDVVCFYGDDGTGKDSVNAVKMIGVRVS